MCSTQLIFYSSLDHYICICCSLDADKTGQHLQTMPLNYRTTSTKWRKQHPNPLRLFTLLSLCIFKHLPKKYVRKLLIRITVLWNQRTVLFLCLEHSGILTRSVSSDLVMCFEFPCFACEHQRRSEAAHILSCIPLSHSTISSIFFFHLPAVFSTRYSHL